MRLARTFHRLPGGIVILAACMSPLPYGSESYGWTCLWLMLLGLAVAMQAITLRGAPSAPTVVVAALLGIGLIAVVAVQVSTKMPQSMQHPAWRVAIEGGIAGISPRLAIEAAAPIYALASPLGILLALIAGYQYAGRRVAAWRLVGWIAGFAAISALIGLAVASFNPGHILFEPKIAYRSDLTGTFVNRNTAATYFGVGALAAFTLAFRAWRQTWPGGYLPARAIFILIANNMTSRAMLWTNTSFFLLIATLMTGSRAGIAFTFIALFLLVALFALNSKLMAWKALSIAIVLLVAIPVTFGAGNLLVRASGGFANDGRYAAWLGIAEVVRAHPIFGVGLGTFKASYPEYRRDNRGVNEIWERAHNTPLELAVELGVPAAVLVTALWLIAMAYFFITAVREPQQFAMPALGLSVMLLVGLHSIVDFPLQIAGCGIPVAILLSAALRYMSNLRKRSDAQQDARSA